MFRNMKKHMRNYATPGNMQQLKYSSMPKKSKKYVQNCAQIFKNMKNYA